MHRAERIPMLKPFTGKAPLACRPHDHSHCVSQALGAAESLCLAQGVTAIAQPGGSLRDFEVIRAVNEAAPQVAAVQQRFAALHQSLLRDTSTLAAQAIETLIYA